MIEIKIDYSFERNKYTARERCDILQSLGRLGVKFDGGVVIDIFDRDDARDVKITMPEFATDDWAPVEEAWHRLRYQFEGALGDELSVKVRESVTGVGGCNPPEGPVDIIQQRLLQPSDNEAYQAWRRQDYRD